MRFFSFLLFRIILLLNIVAAADCEDGCLGAIILLLLFTIIPLNVVAAAEGEDGYLGVIVLLLFFFHRTAEHYCSSRR